VEECQQHGQYRFRLGFTEFLQPQCPACWDIERAKREKVKEVERKEIEKIEEEREYMEEEGWCFV